MQIITDGRQPVSNPSSQTDEIQVKDTSILARKLSAVFRPCLLCADEKLQICKVGRVRGGQDEWLCVACSRKVKPVTFLSLAKLLQDHPQLFQAEFLVARAEAAKFAKRVGRKCKCDLPWAEVCPAYRSCYEIKAEDPDEDRGSGRRTAQAGRAAA